MEEYQLSTSCCCCLAGGGFLQCCFYQGSSSLASKVTLASTPQWALLQQLLSPVAGPSLLGQDGSYHRRSLC